MLSISKLAIIILELKMALDLMSLILLVSVISNLKVLSISKCNI